MTNRVLTLDPAIFPIAPVMPLLMKGTISKGAKVQSVPYPNLYMWKGKIVTAAEAVEIGAEELDKALFALALNAFTSDTVTGFGYSMGSQVLCRWLRDYAPSCPISPTQLKFVAIANPEYQGTSVYFAAKPPFTLPDNGGVGIPDNTKYKCVDFARQYDGMADYPNRPNLSKNSLKNASSGLSSTHNDYWNVTLNDPQNVKRVDGNVTRMMSPTYPLPMISFTWIPGWAKSQDAKLRPEIESGYDRSYLPI